MWKFLFGRYSRLVRSLELAALVLLGVLVYRWFQRGALQAQDYLLILLWCHYFFVRGCVAYRWYPRVKSADSAVPELGIELHFLKALVPISYILFIATLLYTLGAGWFSGIFANIIVMPITIVNSILIGFHLRDHAAHPVNFFTRELILLDEPPAHLAGGHQAHWLAGKQLPKFERPTS